jgi:hypothetical protein
MFHSLPIIKRKESPSSDFLGASSDDSYTLVKENAKKLDHKLHETYILILYTYIIL